MFFAPQWTNFLRFNLPIEPRVYSHRRGEGLETVAKSHLDIPYAALLKPQYAAEERVRFSNYPAQPQQRAPSLGLSNLVLGTNQEEPTILECGERLALRLCGIVRQGRWRQVVRSTGIGARSME